MKQRYRRTVKTNDLYKESKMSAQSRHDMRPFAKLWALYEPTILRNPNPSCNMLSWKLAHRSIQLPILVCAKNFASYTWFTRLSKYRAIIEQTSSKYIQTIRARRVL